ncbi:MAG TPA: hypothetical protein DCF96_08000 [Rhodobacteraceae bacterium]|nr:hypothetical protein [Paracoccaceae bacterium]|tara:strand:+ start:1399 stop:1866 length:468 start_codon:yes stop_codon:yes gene_type:complete
MDLSTYNIHEVEPMGNFEPLPADWYRCVITNAEQKPNSKKTGAYLELRIEVIDGQYQGRLVFDRLNLINPNSVAVDIARRSLASIAHAISVDVKDSVELLDKPLMVKLAVRPAENGYDASNEVKGYDAAVTSVGEGLGAVAPATSNGSATPPWKR